MDGSSASAAPVRSVWVRRGRRAAAVAEGLVAAAAVLVVAACLAVLGALVFDPERGEAWTSGLRPVQFFRELDAELLDDYADVFAVAHNSGDRVGATLEAVGYGADVIEVDVVSLDDRLYAAHGVPAPWIGGTVFRGPPLAQVWVAAAGAGAIKLDLKEGSTAFHELVLDFLADRRGRRRVIVVSGEPAVLRLFAEREPAVLRFLGVGDGGRLRLIVEDPAFAAIVDGVSIRHTLLDAERAAWLEERGLLTLAWTVNDLGRVNELVRLGVDGITTDNLAIMELLGGRQPGDLPLDHLRTPRPPVEEPVPLPGEGGTSAAVSAAGAARTGRGGTRRRPRPAAPTRAGPRRATRSGAAGRGRSWRRRGTSRRPSRRRRARGERSSGGATSVGAVGRRASWRRSVAPARGGSAVGPGVEPTEGAGGRRIEPGVVSGPVLGTQLPS